MSTNNLAQLALLAGIKDYLILSVKFATDPANKAEAEAMLKRLEENKPLADFEETPGRPAATF